MKFCKNCAKPLGEKRKSASYCSNGCRSIAYRNRKGIDAPSFLKSGKSGFQRSRLIFTPEEEQKIKVLELEISNYKEPLELAEGVYKKNHAAKIKIELNARGNIEHGGFIQAKQHFDRISNEIISRKKQIQKILNTAGERTKIETVKDQANNGRFTGSDLLKMKFTTLPFENKWKELIGTPSKSFYGLIWGDAKAGKSYFSLEFAQYLTNFGKTLYIAVEEGISHTLQKKIKDIKANDIEILATRDFNDIAENIKDAEFVFIDSATVINIPPESIEVLRTQFPEVAFIVLLQSTKAGANFKGNQSWKHNADFILELEKIGENSTRATCNGRFGNGKLEYEY